MSLVLDQGYTRTDAARNLDITAQMLGRWVKEHQADDGHAFRGNGKLSLIERSAKDKSPEERRAVRQEQSKPIPEKIKTWLDSKAGKVLPKSPLGKAIHYTLGLWPQLTAYLEDGNVPIDNNPAENAIRPFVIGRNYADFAIMRSSLSTPVVGMGAIPLPVAA